MLKGCKKGEKSPLVYGDGTRKCTVCRLFRPLAEFHKYKTTVQGSCIDCATKRKMAHRAKIRELLNAAKSVPCTDCGKSYPSYVMDFDHMRDKEYTLSRVGQRGLTVAKVLAEIDKCEVVCANCHRERTFSRRN